MTRARRWRWRKGDVCRTSDHFELSVEVVSQMGRCNVVVALVGRPTKWTFPVEWVLDPGMTAVEAQRISIEATRQLDFYLVEHPWVWNEMMGDPWSYAVHHCGTAANIYSRVHWSYFPRTARPQHCDAATPRGLQETVMRITTGQELASNLQQGDYVQIEQDDAKVHHAYADKRTGEARICRPTLFSVNLDRAWRVDSGALPGKRCEICGS